MNELYRLLRPTELEDVIGQDKAVAQVKKFLADKRFPHAVLFSGASGCGKTTLMRIVASKLGCVGSNYIEYNAASSRGIDTVREIDDMARTRELSGTCKIFAIDEAHRWTGEAMDAALKLFEDIPPNVYFMMATTRADKITATLKTRLTPISLNLVSDQDIHKVMTRAAQKIKKAVVGEKVLRAIIEVAGGSPRMALVILNQVMGLETEQEKLDAIVKESAKEESFALVRKLIWQKAKWPEIAKLLDGLEEEAETMRCIILASARGELLKQDGPRAQRAAMIIMAFESQWSWVSGKVGHASLARACWEVVNSK